MVDKRTKMKDPLFLHKPHDTRGEIFYTPTEIMKITGKSKNTIYSWIKQGKLRVKVVNGRKFINKHWFDTWWST